MPETRTGPALHPDFLKMPLAHRGLHGAGVPENSLAAVEAAMAAGYGIEIDVQPSADGQAMVFHDYDLRRLAGDEGFVADLSAAELGQMRLAGSDQAIPTLAALLRLVAGRVPLLIEIKDQDGRMGPGVGELHLRVAEALADYTGPVAVMSFNPHTTTAFHAAAPGIACGLVTCGYDGDDWPMLDAATRARLADIPDFETSGSSFISHDREDLANPAVTRLRAAGVPVLCWTVRSPEAEAEARRVAHNITFEGYRP